VYRHDGEQLLGWTRYHDGKATEFTADGLLVLKKDAKGRPLEARTVVYRQDPPDNRFWVNTKPLKHRNGEEMVTYEYEGDKRKEKSRVKVLESKSETLP
jgi:hypothetical protein